MRRKEITHILLFVGSVILSMSTRGDAQCPVYSINLSGEVRATGSKKEITVRIHSNRKKRISETKVTALKEHFFVAVPFDTYVSNWGGAHNCSRHPTTVDVILVVDDKIVKTLDLSVDRDFVWDSRRGEWRNAVPIIVDEDQARAP